MPVLSVMAGKHAYQIFLGARPPEDRRLRRRWAWSRLAAGGIVVAQGSGYASLADCFAALREDRAARGPAPITINLEGAHTADAAAVVALAVGEREVSITAMGAGTA